MKLVNIQDVKFNLNDELYSWYTRNGCAEVNNESIWHWHPTISKEMNSFIHLCKMRQYPTFIDIGAHVGIFSFVYCSTTINHKCHSVEPIDNHINKIREVGSINNFNLVSHQLGLNEYVGDAYYKNDHMAIFTKDSDDKNVKITTLNEFVTSNNITPNLMKIDVEGYEIPILRKSNLALKNNPDLFIETHKTEAKILGYDINEICEHLTSDNYIFYTYDLSKEIKNLKEYINIEDNMRFVAINKNTI